MQNDTPNSDSNYDSRLAAEGVIKNQLQQIEVLQNEIKRLREMETDSLINNEAFSERKLAHEESTKQLKQAKQAALTTPEAKNISQKLSEAKDRLNDLRKSLSDALVSFEKLAGTNQIEVEDGDVRQISYTAKLIKPI